MTKQVFVRFVWCGKLTKKSVKIDAAFTLLRSFQFKTTINCICSIKALRVFLDRGSIAEMYVSERFPEFPRRPTVIRSIAPLVCTFVDDAHPPEKELDNYPGRRAYTSSSPPLPTLASLLRTGTSFCSRTPSGRWATSPSRPQS